MINSSYMGETHQSCSHVGHAIVFFLLCSLLFKENIIIIIFSTYEIVHKVHNSTVVQHQNEKQSIRTTTEESHWNDQ